MTRIESQREVVNTTQEELFVYLSDLNNFRELLPLDKISDWDASETHCSFKIQNAYKIGLVFDRSEPNSDIYLKSSEDSPFPFELHIDLKEQGPTTEAGLVCEAKINAFLKMMVEKPLKNLFDFIAQRMERKFSK